jgi:hypothetical protein
MSYRSGTIYIGSLEASVLDRIGIHAVFFVDPDPYPYSMGSPDPDSMLEPGQNLDSTDPGATTLDSRTLRGSGSTKAKMVSKGGRKDQNLKSKGFLSLDVIHKEINMYGSVLYQKTGFLNFLLTARMNG